MVAQFIQTMVSQSLLVVQFIQTIVCQSLLVVQIIQTIIECLPLVTVSKGSTSVLWVQNDTYMKQRRREDRLPIMTEIFRLLSDMSETTSSN